MIIEFKKSVYLILPILLISIFLTDNVFGQEDEFKELFKMAKDHSLKGEYRQSIVIYEEILEYQFYQDTPGKVKFIYVERFDSKGINFNV